jgi:hypothetical protein
MVAYENFKRWKLYINGNKIGKVWMGKIQHSRYILGFGQEGLEEGEKWIRVGENFHLDNKCLVVYEYG